MALKQSYKGSTLPEVLVALAITSFCATLAVVIYINIQKSTLPFIRVKAGELAQKYLQEALAHKDYFDNAYTEEEYSIKKTVSRNATFYDCMTVTVKVFDANKKLLTELNAVTPAR
jgi:hypothetical protein